MNDLDQLKFVMRSVGFSPTIDELKAYLEQRSEYSSHIITPTFNIIRQWLTHYAC